MKILVGSEVWQAVKALNCRRNGQRAVVIVSYFGRGGERMLPLHPGDVLVVAASEANVASGLVDPSELLKYPTTVDIYSSSELHGKFYAFGNMAIIGSANVSASSSSQLDEIAVQGSVSQLAVNAVLDRLPKKLLDRSDLRGLEKIYRPPERGGKRLPRPPRAVVRSDKANRRATPADTDRVWYHGTFSEDIAQEKTVSFDLPSMKRLRSGDWYVLVYRDSTGERRASVPRRIHRVGKSGNVVTVRFADGKRRPSRRAVELERLVERGKPLVKRRWLLLSDRIPASKIFRAFGLSYQKS